MATKRRADQEETSPFHPHVSQLSQQKHILHKYNCDFCLTGLILHFEISTEVNSHTHT